jgi:hypothetical protein
MQSCGSEPARLKHDDAKLSESALSDPMPWYQVGDSRFLLHLRRRRIHKALLDG